MGLLPQVALPEIVVEHPQSEAHGDYASSFPLKLARVAKASPLEIAGKVVPLIKPIPEVEKVEIAPPGFVNFTLRGDWLAQQVEVILGAGKDYGCVNLGNGQLLQLEFVSVNPLSLIHI